jgi:cobalt-zinc-cadmium efflux system outer membrane protein
VRLGIQRAGLVVDAAERQFALAAQSSRLATDNLRLAERAFALGETDLPTLLRVRAASWDADANLERRRFARAGAVSRWNQAIGVLP